MSSRVYSYLLIFITETHTHKNTCMISTQEELGQSGTRTCLGGDDKRLLQPFTGMTWRAFFDGYCSTVQGLLDWFEVDLGFTWAFIYSNRFVCSVCFLFSSCPFLDILHCLPRAVAVPLESVCAPFQAQLLLLARLFQRSLFYLRAFSVSTRACAFRRTVLTRPQSLTQSLERVVWSRITSWLSITCDNHVYKFINKT